MMKPHWNLAGWVMVTVAVMGFTFGEMGFEERLAQLRRLKKIIPISLDSTTQNPKMVELGRTLFNDKRFSRNNNLACSSCHIPEKGFSNGLAFAAGTNGDTLSRHVPHLYNLKYNLNFFWDGRATSLEEQLNLVLKSKTELDMNFKEIVARLREDKDLGTKVKEVFPGEEISKAIITKSMVAYEKSIVAGNSPYDNFLNGKKESLSELQLKGFALFIGQANCIACHNGANLSDKTFHNVGVKTTDLGRQLVDKIGMSKEFDSTPYPFFSTFKAFKTPTLRNVANTAPYFHNGSKKTLEEVVSFYNSGGENPNKSGLAKEIVPLGLTTEEETQLVAFLKALSSDTRY